LLITGHDLLSNFVKFQLIAHLLHGGSESFNLPPSYLRGFTLLFEEKAERAESDHAVEHAEIDMEQLEFID